MDSSKVIEILNSIKYFNREDLRFNNKAGYMFSKKELDDFLSLKDQLVSQNIEIEGKKFFKVTPLKPFNSKNIYYADGKYINSLMNDYLSIISDDVEDHDELIVKKNLSDILKSKIFSEIEGTLKIENVSTTHRRIRELFENKELKDKNDIIVKNMIEAISFIVKEEPVFNKENLKKLYDILSDKCLSEDDKLQDGEYYRNDFVQVGGYNGADFNEIDELMNSMFEFANDKKYLNEFGFLMSFICHYYIIYIHPYFDYNGRTARMVSFWISYINDFKEAPFFISQAINENKNEYYKAIVETRNSGNDMTYFIGFLLESSIKLCLIYKNLEIVKNELLKTGDTLTNTEYEHLKKIMLHNCDGYFNEKMFREYLNVDMTKQGALKALNNLVTYSLLEEGKNKKGEKIFKINSKFMVYKYNR